MINYTVVIDNTIATVLSAFLNIVSTPRVERFFKLSDGTQNIQEWS